MITDDQTLLDQINGGILVTPEGYVENPDYTPPASTQTVQEESNNGADSWQVHDAEYWAWYQQQQAQDINNVFNQLDNYFQAEYNNNASNISVSTPPSQEEAESPSVSSFQINSNENNNIQYTGGQPEPGQTPPVVPPGQDWMYQYPYLWTSAPASESVPSEPVPTATTDLVQQAQALDIPQNTYTDIVKWVESYDITDPWQLMQDAHITYDQAQKTINFVQQKAHENTQIVEDNNNGLVHSVSDAAHNSNSSSTSTTDSLINSVENWAKEEAKSVADGTRKIANQIHNSIESLYGTIQNSILRVENVLESGVIELSTNLAKIGLAIFDLPDILRKLFTEFFMVDTSKLHEIYSEMEQKIIQENIQGRHL